MRRAMPQFEITGYRRCQSAMYSYSLPTLFAAHAILTDDYQYNSLLYACQDDL